MDKFILKDKDYRVEKKIEKKIHPDYFKLKDKDVNLKDMRLKDIMYKDLRFKDKDYNEKYDKELLVIKENGDKLLNEWIKKQKEPIVVFLSEFIPNTKISKELEKFKPIIKTTPVISIEEYRKKKKIGEEGVKYLKKLKEKYGNIVLKVLWANINF